MRPTARLALGLILIVLAAGCGASRPTFTPPDIPAGFPNHDLPFIIGAVAASAEPFGSLESKSRMRYETPDESRSVNLDITYRRADSLLVEAKVILGIEAVRSLITPDSFYVYNRLSKQFFRGAVSQAYRLVPTPGSIEELFENVTGTTRIAAGAKWQVSHDSSYYYVSSVDETMSYTVDPRLWRVIEQEATTTSGDVIERRTYSDFDSFGEFVVPRRIEVVRPPAGEQYQLYHRSVTVNPAKLSFRFDVGRVDENIVVREPE